MLPDYGVVIGRYVGNSHAQGQWFHVKINIDTGGSIYEASVDVNQQNGTFEYQIFNKLDLAKFGGVDKLADGWHHLQRAPGTGAIDYIRSDIFKQSYGCLALFWTVFNAIFHTDRKVWSDASGNAAGEALLRMVENSQRVFAFGAPYTSGLGVHDVHYNQGDPYAPPPAENHQGDDGIWQDGYVFALQQDGTLSAYLGKFSTQSLSTDNNGLPV